MTSPATYAKTLAALVVLLGLAIASYALPLGPFSLLAALTIAGTKATLVALIFMHLRWSSPRMRLFAAAGLVWLAILITLTLADFLTRQPVPLPQASPPASTVPDEGAREH